MSEIHFILLTGIEVSLQYMEKIVNDIFEEHKNTIVEQRYRTNGMHFAFLFCSIFHIDKLSIHNCVYEL